MGNGCILKMILLCEGPIQKFNTISIMLLVSFSLKRHPLEVIPTPYQGLSILRLQIFSWPMLACYLLDGLQGCEIEVVPDSNSEWLQASWSCSRQLIVNPCALFGVLRVHSDGDGYLYCLGVEMMFSHKKIVWKYNYGRYIVGYFDDEITLGPNY